MRAATYPSFKRPTCRYSTLARAVVAEAVESRVLLSTYFVSAALGLDSNPGTSDSAAFKTLQKAANTARAGDTVYVRAGTYTAGMNLYGHSGGRAGSPVSFLADPGAIITRAATSGVNASMAAINIENTSWIVVQGFTINDVNQTTNRAGIRVALSPNSVVRNNTITGAYNGVFASRSDNVLVEGNVCRNSYGEHGIYVNGSANYVIRGNETYGNPWNGIHTNVSDGVNEVNTGGLIEDNVVHDNDLAGMDLTGISNAMIRNNLVYDNGRHAVVLQNGNQEATVASHDVTFVNNTLDAQQGSSAFAIQFAPLSSQPAGSPWTGNDNNMTLFNNILIGNQSGAYGAIGTSRVPPATFRSDHNVTDGRFSTNLGSGPLKSLAQWRTATGQDARSSTATGTQLFVNAAGNDYHLKVGAPALDVGAGSFNGTSAPSADAQGEVRPQGLGYDAGYDELPVATADIASRSVGYADGSGNLVLEDKQALRPGGAATLANYTSDSEGITAVAIDVNRLPAGAGPSASSFTLRNGNGTSWNTAPPPSGVIVRRGGGANGSDRVILTWPAGAVRNTWLEVTVKPDSATGLGAPDVFVFGNLAGDTGDAAGDAAVVNVRDFVAIMRAMNLPATAGAPSLRFDFNHDGAVNARDLLAARSNAEATLPLFRPGATTATADRSGSGDESLPATDRVSRARPRRAAYDVLAP